MLYYLLAYLAGVATPIAIFLAPFVVDFRRDLQAQRLARNCEGMANAYVARRWGRKVAPGQYR